MDYFKTFDFVRPLLQTKEALHLAPCDVVRQAAQENVIYTEIRFAPELSMDEGVSASETVEAVLAGLKQAEEDFGIVAKVLVCGMKQSPKEVTRDIFEHVVELAEKGLVGFDFAGNELDFPPAQFLDLKNAGAKITINTDNRTVSDTNLTKEYALFVKHFGVSVADFLAFNKNAIQASFTNEAHKAELLSKIDNLYETFL